MSSWSGFLGIISSLAARSALPSGRFPLQKTRRCFPDPRWPDSRFPRRAWCLQKGRPRQSGKAQQQKRRNRHASISSHPKGLGRIRLSVLFRVLPFATPRGSKKWSSPNEESNGDWKPSLTELDRRKSSWEFLVHDVRVDLCLRQCLIFLLSEPVDLCRSSKHCSSGLDGL